MLPKTILYYGIKEPPSDQLELRAGPLVMALEPQAGFLRYVRLGGCEILRGIYMAVRDHNWDTIAPRLSNLRKECTDRTFRLIFDMACVGGDVDFLWKGALTGEADGTVTYGFDGVARSDFRKNRLGFCILHPIPPCAGRPCTVTQADGAVVKGVFPKPISPHQPFKNIRAIEHEVAPGLTAEVTFDGEVFEMEDQRNWTDASFKTYCTPLGLPFPVEVKKGTRIQQTVTLRLKGRVDRLPSRGERRADEIELDVGSEPLGRLPAIGLAVAGHGRPLSERQVARLKALHLGHLRVDLRLFEPGWIGELERATKEARSLGTALEAALFLSDDAENELAALASGLERLRPPVALWLVFHRAEKSTGEKWVRLARKGLSAYDKNAKVGAGTNAYFAELNRGRPPVPVIDAVCYSINPQVHAFDKASLVETLEGQGYTVRSAMAFAGGRPIVVTPVTLKPRFNPNATGPEPTPAPGELPSQVDARQMSLFGAAWTLGSLKYLAECGAASVTYYETTGWRGVMETEDGLPLPEKFRSLPGAVFPLYHVLADVGQWSGGSVMAVESSDQLRGVGLATVHGGRLHLLLANLTDRPQRFAIRGPMGGEVSLRQLDETNAEAAMTRPEEFRAAPGRALRPVGGVIGLDLLPYAVARLDAAMEVNA